MSQSSHPSQKPKSFLRQFKLYLVPLLIGILSFHAQAQSTPLSISKTIYGAGEIFVPCQIEGVEESCKLDMGAPFSVFSLEDAKGLNVINQIDYVGVSGHSAKCDVVMTQNPVSFGTVAVNESLFLNCPQRISRHHLLGLNHLMTQAFKIDFKEHSLSHFPTTDVLDHEYQVDSSGHVFIKIRLAKANQEVELMAMLDTGAGLTIINQDIVASVPQFFTSLGTNLNNIQDTNSNAIQSKMVLGSTIKIDQARIAVPYLMVMDLSELKKSTGLNIDMIIGLNVLRELKSLSINPSNTTWSVR